MASIELSGVRKAYGPLEVMSGIDLGIEKGEFAVFVGPSGSGKSTLLRMIAGLEHITGGTLTVDGTIANDTPAAQRGMAMVFQSYALYPHKTVYRNLSFGLQIARVPKDEIHRRVTAAAEMLQLTPYLSRYPRHLSGGQRQRVAIGRAIVREAKIFLFDEPLSNLDAALRSATRVEIARLKERLPDTTMIYVTHDQVEAMTLADRIVVLNHGRIEQVGRPTELYARPANLFVAGFIGSPQMNLLPVTVAGGTVTLAGRALPGLSFPHAPDGQATLGLRPEHLSSGDETQAVLTGTVDLVEQLGEVSILHLTTPAGEVQAKVDGMTSAAKGDRLHLVARPEQAHLFDAKGQRI